jgi:AraC-like DNA-binding protein
VYAEWAARLPGAVVWTNRPPVAGAPVVLPDGCMDLMWSEGRLLVAGPDTRAHVTGGTDGAGGTGDTGGRWAGVRFFPGSAPVYLGVPAAEVRDRRVELADVMGMGRARRLTALVNSAADPVRGIEDAALLLAEEVGPADRWPRLLVEALDQGHTVAAAADGLGLGARQLHRRSLAAFGYGPKTLARVLRLRRALDLARAGVPAAETAARAGFADQAHLARDVRELTGLPLTRLLGPGSG